MSVASVFFTSLIDYAGLFPPAQLDLPAAVREYAAALAGPHRAMLGRFVLPLARLAEFDAVLAALPSSETSRWQLSVLAGSDAAADAASIAAFNSRPGGARIVSVETKAATAIDVARLTAPFPSSLEVWVEISPSAPDLAACIDAIRVAGRGAKIRTGGVTSAAFPAAALVARFLRECQRARVPSKATAGLHHPLRGDYRLTYAAGSPHGRMFGFLNIFLAAALVHSGASEADTIALLEDGDATNFRATSDALTWRTHRFDTAALQATRRALCRSFGSCSFAEPVEGLQQLHWL